VLVLDQRGTGPLDVGRILDRCWTWPAAVLTAAASVSTVEEQRRARAIAMTREQSTRSSPSSAPAGSPRSGAPARTPPPCGSCGTAARCG
jgi:hypothetical protein